MRPSPPKPWEKGTSSTTSSVLSTQQSTSSITGSTSSIHNGSSRLPPRSGSPNSTSNNQLSTRPRTPMRPWDSSGTSSYDSSMTGYGSGSSYGSGGLYGSSGYGSGYGSSYGGSGYGTSSLYGGGGSGYGSGLYGSGYGSSSYGSGYGSSYGAGGYGSSYGAGGYGSSYGGGYGSGYGGGYGGYGSSYGGGYGRDDMKGGMMNGHSWLDALNSMVETFGRFSFLLNSNFDAVRVSFSSVVRLCHSMSQFHHEVFSLVKTFTLFRLFQSVSSKFIKLFRYILRRPTVDDVTNKEIFGLDDFKKFEKKQGGGITTFIIIIAVTFIAVPMIIGQMFGLSRRRKGENSLDKSWDDLGEVTVVQAVADFDPETQRDLPLRVGDIINVIGKPHQEWWEGEHQGRTGLFPANFVKIIDSNDKQQQSQQQQSQRLSSNSRQRQYSPPTMEYQQSQQQYNSSSSSSQYTPSPPSQSRQNSPNKDKNPSFNQDGADYIRQQTPPSQDNSRYKSYSDFLGDTNDNNNNQMENSLRN
ncbi:SH3 domain-containing protein [Heterostelium album PN500]|uniref:Peroxisomal membrane protein PEX13 n=1 Tax=Heterostelium pallidum (strain ATCC 26659 / Pp 5 / PN500) TaxID=670386 RepID=D3B3N9_HETP5|nr:SH3 domain-containing protein [Heterostelium album PN500]EFA83937.1 SH3 domain-containing protein [Heterostelium album PN500]|eukprot:XP_020436054.1 SH3 domain-containing protein [Heterostelium album PN500]